MFLARSYLPGDVVTRGDQVGVITHVEPYTGPTVLWLPDGLSGP